MNLILINLVLCLFQSETPEIQKPTGPKKIDGIVAIVNNEVITESELLGRLESEKKTFGFTDPEQWERFKREKLLALVIEKLYAQAAKRASLDQSQIDEEVRRILQNEEKKAGGKSELIEKLQQLGRSYEEFTAEIKNDVLAYSLRGYELGYLPGSSGRPGTELYISPGEMKQYYLSHTKDFLQQEAVRGRQIFLSFADTQDIKSAQALADELLTKIKSGADFVSLAKQHSDWKPQDGGDLGWVEKSGASFDKSITGFLFNSPAGSVSEVLLLRSGLAIVKVEETRPRKQKSFEEAQLQIFLKMLEERKMGRLESLQSRLFRESYVWPPDLVGR